MDLDYWPFFVNWKSFFKKNFFSSENEISIFLFKNAKENWNGFVFTLKTQVDMILYVQQFMFAYIWPQNRYKRMLFADLSLLLICFFHYFDASRLYESWSDGISIGAIFSFFFLRFFLVWYWTHCAAIPLSFRAILVHFFSVNCVL